jgi:transposase
VPAFCGGGVFKRFDRWSEKGVWEAMHRFFVDDPDMESVLMDSTIVRAHPCAAGARKSDEDPALGRSRGGFSTKIHVKVDALGNPLEFLLSAGQVSDVSQAPALLTGTRATYAILDKAYDADAVLELIDQQGMMAVIPPKANRTVQREYDHHLYKERHWVECFINKIKHYRHVFSRFDKTARNFMSFIRFAAALIWLR